MLSYTFVLSLLLHSCDSSIVFVQITQQVFVAEEWVRDAHNEANAEALSHAEVKKSLGVLKQERAKLSKKLKEADKPRLSAKVGLKTMERQAEDQRQKLHLTKIDLATEKQLVIDLKAKLQPWRQFNWPKWQRRPKSKQPMPSRWRRHKPSLLKSLLKCARTTAMQHGMRP